MKKIFTLLLLAPFATFAQDGAPAAPYYNGFNFNQTGIPLKTALATKITSTHTRLLTYAEAESAIKVVDRDPVDQQNVFLIYGYSPEICNYVANGNFGTSANSDQHRKRNRNADVENTDECAWNREHVYAKAKATPALSIDQPSAGTDAHHLRSADVSRNNMRSSLKFAAGSGTSKTTGGGWYPGDEWKGDVARMMMYMYLHYPTQCKPTNIGTGATVSVDSNMIQLFLQWNAEDPVSPYEDARNTYLGNASNNFGQGNRNPFIDNPYLATVIWGGPVAQNRWPNIFLGTNTFDYERAVKVYPNPSHGGVVNVSSTIPWTNIRITNINGQVTNYFANPTFTNNQLQIESLQKGFYFVTFQNENISVTKKLIVN